MKEDNKLKKVILNKQILYEKWSCKDKWFIYKEGIYLLLGHEPLSKSLDKQKIDSLWYAIKESINKKQLAVINSGLTEKQWAIRPVDLYYWAKLNNIKIPQELSLLMDFIIKTVKKSPANKFRDNNENFKIKHDSNKELVLGSAMALLINNPNKCKDKTGKIRVDLIAKNIISNLNKDELVGSSMPIEAEIENLIDYYIRK